MLDLVFIPLLLVYFSILTLLFVYGLNFFHLTWIAWRHGKESPATVIPEEWPLVTVQLPVYNEMYVARRLIDAAARLDYPMNRLEIQVLDDSTDETRQVVDEAVTHWRALGLNIKTIRRPARAGFKAGALANALAETTADYVAMFDADFIPPPEFLKRACPVLYADVGLAFVQTRWGHTNSRHSLLTLLQSLSIDGHFAVEQYARWRAGYPFNFNGTAGLWRREALLDAGGWHSETLTEDLDISYRAFLRGWRAAYLRDVVSPAELPVSFDAYRRQQSRWARGTFQCAARHLPAVWGSAESRMFKVEATLHLTGYAIHLLMLSLTFLYPLLILVAERYPVLLSLFGFMALFNVAGLAPTALFISAQGQLGERWWRRLPSILLLSVLGAGMMATTARAALQSFSKQAGTFERTPKFGLGQQRRQWKGLRYQLPLDKIVIVELILSGFNFYTSFRAFNLEAWAVSFYTGVFSLGLAVVALCTVYQALSARPKAGPQEPETLPALAATSSIAGD